jgi:hypothetical protein
MMPTQVPQIDWLRKYYKQQKGVCPGVDGNWLAFKVGDRHPIGASFVFSCGRNRLPMEVDSFHKW